MLMNDLDEAEEQYRLALRTHLQNIDALIELQNQRMADLDSEFETDLKELKTEFEDEKAIIRAKHDKEVERLNAIMSAIRKDAEEQDNEITQDFSQKRDETRDKEQEEYNVLKQMLENEILEYQHTINHEHEKYMASAQEKMKTYMDLTNKDTETAEHIARQMRKIHKLQETIANWKANLQNNINECEERDKSMKEEKEQTAKHFKELKLKMQRWRKQQEDKLNRLVTQARDTKQALGVKSKKAQRILRLSELCRSLETERERVLNFANDISIDEVEKDVRLSEKKQLQFEATDQGNPMPPMDAETDKAAEEMGQLLRQDSLTEEWQYLENFWRKFNKVLLDNAAIAREKYHLLNENQKLRSLLKQYLDGISVNNDVMGGRNNLLACGNFRPTQGVAGQQSGHGLTVIEAREVVHNQVRQRGY